MPCAGCQRRKAMAQRAVRRVLTKAAAAREAIRRRVLDRRQVTSESKVKGS
jgi:hypothetical protein